MVIVRLSLHAGKQVHTIKKDKWFRIKGSMSAIIAINCKKCKAKLMIYQKDGPQGMLKRCYYNRVKKYLPDANRKSQILLCGSCNRKIGEQSIWKGRKCWSIMRGSFNRSTILKYGR